TSGKIYVISGTGHWRPSPQLVGVLCRFGHPAQHPIPMLDNSAFAPVRMRVVDVPDKGPPNRNVLRRRYHPTRRPCAFLPLRLIAILAFESEFRDRDVLWNP